MRDIFARVNRKIFRPNSDLRLTLLSCMCPCSPQNDFFFTKTLIISRARYFLIGDAQEMLNLFVCTAQDSSVSIVSRQCDSESSTRNESQSSPTYVPFSITAGSSLGALSDEQARRRPAAAAPVTQMVSAGGRPYIYTDWHRRCLAPGVTARRCPWRQASQHAGVRGARRHSTPVSVGRQASQHAIAQRRGWSFGNDIFKG